MNLAAGGSRAAAFLIVLAALSSCERIADRPGNFGVVEAPSRRNGGIYRGAQPTATQVAALRRDLGVRTIVKLNVQDLEEERAAARRANIVLVEIPLDPNRLGTADPATVAGVEKAVRAMTDPANAPVYIHCLRGSERAGFVVALHRARNDGWSFAEISDELSEYGHGRLMRLRMPAMTRAIEAETRKPAGRGTRGFQGD
ncbi:MAG TPA: hypothetical protein VGF40_15650 [Thermoanaerobaculia bacterium]